MEGKISNPSQYHFKNGGRELVSDLSMKSVSCSLKTNYVDLQTFPDISSGVGQMIMVFQNCTKIKYKYCVLCKCTNPLLFIRSDKILKLLNYSKFIELAIRPSTCISVI